MNFNLPRPNFQNKKQLISIGATVFVLLAIPITVFLALSARQLQTPAADIPGNQGPKIARFAPVIFLAKDSQTPSADDLQKVSNALDSIKYYFALQAGETFEYLPPKIVRGTQSKLEYTNTDYFSCGSSRMDCNIVHELISLEKSTLNFFGVRNTGIGWHDRTPLVFTYDVFGESEARGLTMYSGDTTKSVSWSILTDPVINGIIHDSGKCSGSGHLFPPDTFWPEGQLSCYITAHEIGHAFGLGHPCLPGNVGLMCKAYDRPEPFYPNGGVQLGPDEISIVRASEFSNPVEILNPLFCFAAATVTDWCLGADTFAAYRYASTSAAPPHSYTPDDRMATTTPDCCRVEVNNQTITLGGFTIEVCGKGIDRNNASQRSIGCRITNEDMVQTYSKTINLQPLDSSGNPLYYDIYVDYKTISPQNGTNVPFKDRRIPWKEIKNQSALCFGTTCPVNISWAVPKLQSTLYQSGTSVSACQGYSSCDNTDSINENATSLKPRFTGLPPKLAVDMVVKIQAFENTGSLFEHFKIGNFNTPDCSNKPTAPGGVTIGTQSLAGEAGSQSVTLNWNAASVWGNECNYTNPREYVVAIGTTNPPPLYKRVQTLSTTINNLSPGKTYYWQIAAENKGNVKGSYSAQGSFTTAPALPTNTFKGKYFNNEDFSDLKFEKSDPRLNFAWFSGSPSSLIDSDTFSVEWFGTFAFDGTKYRLNIHGDDKLQVYIDGNLALSSLQSGQVANSFITPTAGVHEVKVIYSENSGSAFAKVNWVKPNCPDFNADNAVNSSDVKLLSEHYGNFPTWDITGDNIVNSLDLQRVSSQFGKTCT